MTVVHQIPRRLFLGTSSGVSDFTFLDENGVGVYVDERSHLKLTRFDGSDDTTGTPESGWTATGIPGVPTISLAEPLTDGQTLLVWRRNPLVQNLNLGPDRAYDSSDIERQLDHQVRYDQDIAARISILEAGGLIDQSALIIPVTSEAPIAGRGFLYDTGTGVVFLAGTGVPGASAYDIWIAEGNTGSKADFLDTLIGGNLRHGAGYRENHDGSVDLWGVGGGIVANTDKLITLPVALQNTNYAVVAMIGGIAGDYQLTLSARTSTGFTIQSNQDAPNTFWHIMGGSL